MLAAPSGCVPGDNPGAECREKPTAHGERHALNGAFGPY